MLFAAPFQTLWTTYSLSAQRLRLLRSFGLLDVIYLGRTEFGRTTSLRLSNSYPAKIFFTVLPVSLLGLYAVSYGKKGIISSFEVTLWQFRP